MKSGKYKIDFGNQFNDLLNSENGEDKLNIAFQSAWNAYTYDNVDVFYIDVEKLTLTTKTTSFAGLSSHKVELSNGSNANYLKDNFNSIEKIENKESLLNSICKQIANQLEGHDKIEKIKYVHDWLVDTIEYDSNFESQEPYSIVGALTEGKAVCEGYARSFKYIMDELGIPCVVVSGTGRNSEGKIESHAWNYVQIDDNWYAVDVTWDDPIIIGNGTVGSDVKYKHFLKGSNTFFTTHTEDGYITSNSIKFEFPQISEYDY